MPQLLAHQIKAYREFALANSSDASELQQRLSDYTVALLHQFGAAQDESELRQRLAMDMQLNAQGLQVWRQRASRA